MRKVSIALLVLVLVATLVGTTAAQGPAIQPVSPSHPVVPVAPAPHPEDVLWDQPLSTVNTNSYVDQQFTDYTTYSSYLADDFTNAASWDISTIFVPGGGWNGFTTLMNATALVWQIYADNGGVPAGNPEAGGAFWSLSLAPTDAQVTITNGSYGYPSDTLLTLAAPVTLPAGNWWFVFYPVMAFSGGGQYGRQPSDTLNGLWGQFINPQGGFGYGTAWQSWAVIGATNQDTAFRLEGVPTPLNSLHLFKMKLGWVAGGVPGTYKVTSAVTVHDQDHALAPGVTVTAAWTAPNGKVTNQTAVTNPKGQAKFALKAKVAGTFQFCVLTLAKTGYVDNPGADHIPRCKTIV